MPELPSVSDARRWRDGRRHLGRRFEILPQPKLAFQLSLILWLAVLSFVAPTTLLTGQVQTPGEVLSLFTELGTALLIAFVLYAGFRAMAGMHLWLAYAVIAFAILVAAFAQTAAGYAGQFLLQAIFRNGYLLPQTTPSAIGRTALVYWCLYTCNAALFWLSFVKGHADKERAMRTEAELAMLRLQLNPHFMVNSLGTISDLVSAGATSEAAIVTDKLAAFLRSSLQISGEPLITLSEELFAVEAYLGVEEVRFGERLEIAIDCPERLEPALVPNFILQPLVENVLRHSVAVSRQTLRIAIVCAERAGKLHIDVTNNFPDGALAMRSKGLGIGLANCRARLDLLYGSRAALATRPAADGFCVLLEMPLTY